MVRVAEEDVLSTQLEWSSTWLRELPITLESPEPHKFMHPFCWHSDGTTCECIVEDGERVTFEIGFGVLEEIEEGALIGFGEIDIE